MYGIILFAALASACTHDGDLRRFYSENDGKALRRLPSYIVPENAFISISNPDFDDFSAQNEIWRAHIEDSDYNVLTYTLRCVPDLSDRRVEEIVRKAAKAYRAAGIELAMDIDARIARNEFLRRWPEDALRVRRYEYAKANTAGTACFNVKTEFMRDHMCYGTEPYSGHYPPKLISVRQLPSLVKIDGIRVSEVTTNGISGAVGGLKPGDEILVETEFRLKEADPTSPRLNQFVREMMLRYRKLGISSAMRDEWGYQTPRTAMREHRAFWYSDHFRDAYAKTSGGRNLDADMPRWASNVVFDGQKESIAAYFKTIYSTCKANEEYFYAANREYFGADVHVTKHATWLAYFTCAEFAHNGFDWWVAKRDWAQSDESTPVPVCNGMMKKFGTPLWLNEGYGPDAEHYLRAQWRYILCGGRLVYHGIYNPRAKMSSGAAKRFGQLDLLNTAQLRAEEMSRLLPLISRAPIDSPVAHIFGYDRMVDWSDSHHEKWGEEIAHGLGFAGYAVDAYPANEIRQNTFRVDADGYVTVGRQRYEVCTLVALSQREREEWQSLVHGKSLKTRVFNDPSLKEVVEYIASIGAVRQTPLTMSGLTPDNQNRLPPTEGTLRLTDGTVAVIKAGKPDWCGDPISGAIETGGLKVEYSARGMFAARAKAGELLALAGGEVSYVRTKDFELRLNEPTDIALVKIDGTWHGVWQNADYQKPVPAELVSVTPNWVRLRGVRTDRRVRFEKSVHNCRPGESEWRKSGGWVRPGLAWPGLKPFDPPEEIVLECAKTYGGKIELLLATAGNPKNRQLFRFTNSWNNITRFDTSNLPKGGKYVLWDFRIASADKAFAANAFEALSINGVYSGNKAQALALEVRTRSPISVVEGDSVPLALVNRSGDLIAVRGKVRACGFRGSVTEHPFSATIPPRGEFVFEMPARGLTKGVWRTVAEVECSDGSKAVTDEVRFAVLDEHKITPSLAAGKFRMGINYHRDKYFPQCQKWCDEALARCGAKLVRTGFGSWAAVQPDGPDDYRWDNEDRKLAALHALGIDVNGGCWSVPYWAADDDMRRRAKEEGNWKLHRYLPPKDTAVLERYYETLARRYGKRLAYYEIGNEWDLKTFFPGTTDQAIRATKAVANALRRGCPAATITACGWACADDSRMIANTGIQERVMHEVKDLVNVHAVHLHGNATDFKKRLTKSFFPLRERAGVSIPWYANETAISTTGIGESSAAETVWKKILLAWAYGSTDYIWYNLRATGWDPKDPEQGYGLLTADFRPRDTYAAFSSLTALLNGFDFTSRIASETDREFYRFDGVRDGVKEVVVAGWEGRSRQWRRSVSVVTDAQSAHFVDLMGNTREIPIVGGKVAWTVSSTPSALRLVAADTADIAATELAVSPVERMSIHVGNGKRPPDLVADGKAFVHEFFEANPAMTHRLWKGTDDCSFKAWFSKGEAPSIVLRIDVTDDVHRQHAPSARAMSEGDCARVDFEIAGQDGIWHTGLRRCDDGRSEAVVWRTPKGFSASASCSVIRLETSRNGNVTSYVAEYPSAAFGFPADPFAGDVKVSVKVDDADYEDRNFWIGLDGLSYLLR